MSEHRHPKSGPRWYEYVAVGLAVAFLVVFLTSCQTVDPCNTCIGPYDITLTSHREALQ